jgi:cytochrome c
LSKGSAVFVTAIALAASLLLARVHPFGDAGLYGAEPSAAAGFSGAAIPPEVRPILTAKCADCHSTQTHTPVYGRFAPISWLMERDIIEGRRHMDFSRWDSYTRDQQETLQAKILQEIKGHEMPLLQYRMIHRNSAITSAELQTLTQWVHSAAGADSITQTPRTARDPDCKESTTDTQEPWGDFLTPRPLRRRA